MIPLGTLRITRERAREAFRQKSVRRSNRSRHEFALSMQENLLSDSQWLKSGVRTARLPRLPDKRNPHGLVRSEACNCRLVLVVPLERYAQCLMMCACALAEFDSSDDELDTLSSPVITPSPPDKGGGRGRNVKPRWVSMLLFFVSHVSLQAALAGNGS